MRVLIRGGGDIASGTALRLHRAGMEILITELARPSAIRRSVSFASALYQGSMELEGVQGLLARDGEEALSFLSLGQIPILADPEGASREWFRPDAVVDATLIKRNITTKVGDAPIVIGLGPGFVVGVLCDAAVETMRGHQLGRVYYRQGESPLADTGIPGLVGGYGAERVLHSPCAGIFRPLREIGDRVEAGDCLAMVGAKPLQAKISGVLRGILPQGYPAHRGMKCADVDPRCEREHCFTVSDKARAVGGGALEAILAMGKRA